MGTIRRSELDGAVRGGILDAQQADRLVAFLEGDATLPSGGAGPRFTIVHALYYLGGMIAIGAMSIFMTLGWNALGGWGGFVTAVLYAVLALALTHWFLEAKHLEIPAGITATLAVVMVPLAIFCAQMALGYWTDAKNYRDYHVFIDWRWLMMEFGTLAVGAILLWRYRFPFMLMPIAVTLWYMSMDLVPFLLGQERVYDWEIRKFISVWFGLAMTLVAFWVDLRSRFSRDYAFWLYLFGVLTFWGGLSLINSGSELGKLAYCGINVAMILLGAVIGRRVFAVFGGLGVAGYLGYLSYKVFKDSMIFPLALSLVGLAIIGLGVLWQRREAQWSARLRGFLPGPLRELIETRAAR
jgi:Ca2+/Na+ antiporter